MQLVFQQPPISKQDTGTETIKDTRERLHTALTVNYLTQLKEINSMAMVIVLFEKFKTFWIHKSVRVNGIVVDGKESKSNVGWLVVVVGNQ